MIMQEMGSHQNRSNLSKICHNTGDRSRRVTKEDEMKENEFTSWLLNASSPSIRYLCLADLIGYPAGEPRLVQARREIMTGGAVEAILDHQSRDGSWEGERSYYTPKYFSSHWSMLLLTELCVDGNDVRFQAGARHMLDATEKELQKNLDAHGHGWACFYGNLLRYVLHAGMEEDARTAKVIHFLCHDLLDSNCWCVHNGETPCAWGVARAIWGLAAIPGGRQSPEVTGAIKSGIKFLLDSFQLVKADYPTHQKGEVSPIWFKLNFPLFYQSDILFVLRVLDEFSLLDHPGAQAALDWLEQKRGADGRWTGSSPFRQRTWRELGNREETERWVSLQASRILIHAGRDPEAD